MLKKLPLLLVFLFTVLFTQAQTNLNDYKYIIVPNTYEFLDTADEYRLNSLTKFLFEKYKFQALMADDPLPEDIINNGCLALKADVLNDSGMFTTKLKIQLKNCKGEVVFLSQDGISKDKKFSVAYNLALRQAFNSFDAIAYQYKPKALDSKQEAMQDSKEKQEEIIQLKAEIKALKDKQPEQNETVDSEVNAEAKDEMLDHKDQKTSVAATMLYAQAIPNGFQLVNSVPELVYKIKKTSLINVYLIEGGAGLIYKQGAKWILETYVNDVLITKALQIKF